MSDSSSSDPESGHAQAVKEHYAIAYEYRNEKEELAALKKKYGSDAEESDISVDSESDESEDEDGEELTPAVDAAILRTLAMIKRRDPGIYDAEKDVFQEEQKRTPATQLAARARKDKSKPVTMRQVQLQSQLNGGSRSPSPEPLTHVDEQRALRSETIAAFHTALDSDQDDDEGEDGLLVPREKTRDEREIEEDEYRAFLENEVGQDLAELVTVDSTNLREPTPEPEAVEELSDDEQKEGESKSKARKRKERKDKLRAKLAVPAKPKETDQEFLMNYIIGRKWIDKTTDHVPTWNEITESGPSRSKGKARATEADEDGSDDGEVAGNIIGGGGVDEDDFEEIVDRFETSYNFRFEEPDAANIKGFPRNVPGVVRREDTTRKDARERRKVRKEEEMAKKKEEVKRLKALKMRELRSKLEQIGKEGGRSLEESKALQELDLEGDWDPDAHDNQMLDLYGDDDVEDDGKPTWDDDIDIGDIPMSVDGYEPFDMESTEKIKKKKKKKKGKGGDDPMDEGVDMDAMDADAASPVAAEGEEEWDGTEEMRKRKLDEYMDEIYGLEFNDMVAGMPTRFKYTQVAPQSFALTPAEILMATDQELNQYLSVKKFAPYRKESNWDLTRNDRLKEFKTAVAERVPRTDRGEAEGAERPVKKRKGKKERMKLKEGEVEETPVPAAAPETSSKKRKAEDEGDAVDEAGDDEPEKESKAKKRRRRQKKNPETAQA